MWVCVRARACTSRHVRVLISIALMFPPHLPLVMCWSSVMCWSYQFVKCSSSITWKCFHHPTLHTSLVPSLGYSGIFQYLQLLHFHWAPPSPLPCQTDHLFLPREGTSLCHGCPLLILVSPSSASTPNPSPSLLPTSLLLALVWMLASGLPQGISG